MCEWVVRARRLILMAITLKMRDKQIVKVQCVADNFIVVKTSVGPGSMGED